MTRVNLISFSWRYKRKHTCFSSRRFLNHRIVKSTQINSQWQLITQMNCLTMDARSSSIISMTLALASRLVSFILLHYYLHTFTYLLHLFLKFYKLTTTNCKLSRSISQESSSDIEIWEMPLWQKKKTVKWGETFKDRYIK